MNKTIKKVEPDFCLGEAALIVSFTDGTKTTVAFTDKPNLASGKELLEDASRKTYTYTQNGNCLEIRKKAGVCVLALVNEAHATRLLKIINF